MKIKVRFFFLTFMFVTLFPVISYSSQIESSGEQETHSSEVVDSVKSNYPKEIDEKLAERMKQMPPDCQYTASPETEILETDLDQKKTGNVKKHVVALYLHDIFGKLAILEKKTTGISKVWESDENFRGMFPAVMAGDINNDGKKEIIVTISDGAKGYTKITLYEWENGKARLILRAGGVGWDYEIKDIDGDGVDEVMIPDYRTGETTIYKWDGKIYKEYSRKKTE